MSGASAVLADNLCIQIEQGVGQTVMLEEEEEGEDEGDVGDREGGMELDMWEGQFSLGGVGEGLGEGVWRQEEGVSCRKLAQEVWASQQEKEQADREAEEVFTDAVNFAAIHVTTIPKMQLFLRGYLDFGAISTFSNFLSIQVQQLQEQVGQLAESQATTDDR